MHSDEPWEAVAAEHHAAALAAFIALTALAPHLPRYLRSVTHYAAELTLDTRR